MDFRFRNRVGFGLQTLLQLAQAAYLESRLMLMFALVGVEINLVQPGLFSAQHIGFEVVANHQTFSCGSSSALERVLKKALIGFGAVGTGRGDDLVEELG